MRVHSAIVGSLIGCIVVGGGLNAQGVAAAAPTLAEVTVRLIPPVRAGVTLGRWRAAHPADTLSRVVDPDDQGFGCTRATSWISLADGDTVRVVLDFYVPPDPKHGPLPSGLSSHELLDQCQAGAAQMWLQDTSTSRALAIKASVESALAAEPGLADSLSPWQGTEPAARDGTYRLDDSVAVATMRLRYAETQEDARVINRNIIFIAVRAKRSHVSMRDDVWTDSYVYRTPLTSDLYTAFDQADRRVIDRTMASFDIAAIGGDVERALRSLLHQADNPIFEPMSDPETVIPALGQWIRKAGKLPRARRAAALYVADALIDRWTGGYVPIDTSGNVVYDRLVKTGALFDTVRSSGGDGWFGMFGSARNWLKQAVQIAPNSRAGRFAFLTLAESGFRTVAHCDSVAQTLIAQGAEYLRRHPKSPVRSEVHLLMGAAWSDVLYFAINPDDPQAPTADVARQRHVDGEIARAHSIDQYVLGFRIAPDQPQTRAAWDDAWRLMAGLPPQGPFFDCRDD